jgi:hypothetical protein
VARPLAEALSVGSFDHHDVEADAIDRHPADPFAALDLVLEEAGEQPDPLLDVIGVLRGS